jgi:hypothetical protein
VPKLGDLLRLEDLVEVATLADDLLLDARRFLPGLALEDALRLANQLFVIVVVERSAFEIIDSPTLYPSTNLTSSSVQRSRWRVIEKSVSPRSRILSNPARRHSAIALSRTSGAPSCDGLLPLRLRRNRGSCVLANETTSGW